MRSKGFIGALFVALLAFGAAEVGIGPAGAMVGRGASVSPAKVGDAVLAKKKNKKHKKKRHAAKALPSVCDVLSAADVGGVVGRPMTAMPTTAGKGCLYTATDQPNIDVTTAYPPYISQVSIFYNAPQPGLTAKAVKQLFLTSRGTNAAVAGIGDQAYTSGGGSIVVLSRKVMIGVSTSGTMRPESIVQVQGWCGTIALMLRAKLPV